MALKLLSPAKVNLFLDVVSKRPDGFHNILTVFERIDLLDEIELDIIKSGIVVNSDSKELPHDESNLAFKAAALFLKKFKIKEGLSIKIKKRIPIAAGLGGGSSNAATVLLGANKLFKTSVKKDRLMSLGAALGSDVPFFLAGSSFAIGQGRGELITPIRLDRKFWHILIYPNIKMYAKDIYSTIKVSKNSYNRSPKLPYSKKNLSLTKDMRRSINNIFSHYSFLFNRLEKAAEKKSAKLRRIKKILTEYGTKPLVSGSGPTIFALVKSRKEAKLIVDELSRQHDWRMFLTRTY